uniref:Uncharacterized protein n=1 Tax=viral metagenome TaxID=1070528 RepID=A0A6M3K8E5_9ZZZZ
MLVQELVNREQDSLNHILAEARLHDRSNGYWIGFMEGLKTAKDLPQLLIEDLEMPEE